MFKVCKKVAVYSPGVTVSICLFTFLVFSSANHSHMMALLQQLLYSESLSLSWRDIIVPVVRQVVQTVRPDVRNCDDDMDIRQLVHIKKVRPQLSFTPEKWYICLILHVEFKKVECWLVLDTASDVVSPSVFLFQIPGGRKFDSAVVNGFVCTKNIAHKKVKWPCSQELRLYFHRSNRYTFWKKKCFIYFIIFFEWDSMGDFCTSA